MFKSVLIANRGEIAVRIIRTCRLLGIETVGVYSDVDASALHVKLADRAVRIGPADPGNSYLNIDRLVQTAVEAGVDALHPGYGFVSENWNLAEKCRQAGIKFVGPSARTLVIAGNKVDCKRIAKKAGVPVIDGGSTVYYTPESALEGARALGYPVLLKAAFGGGGRGIREANDDRQLLQGFKLASTEMKRSLGKSGLFVEKLVRPARHIEVQIIADGRGEVVHLGERECSIQRRHQKLLELSPAPGLDELARMEVTGYAVKLAKALGYENVGTVEFLMDQEQNFYFIEVNSRLQVEHPVTEMRAGVDLVKAQLKIAAGGRIGYSQDDVELKGTAIQCRVNAEDPAAGFAPSSGRVERLFFPGGAGVRIDTALYPGYDVPEYYDSLLAKVIVYGNDLEDARRRMLLALSEFSIGGLKTTIPLHQYILRHEKFTKWDFNVRFLEENKIVETLADDASAERRAATNRAAAVAAALLESGFRAPVKGGTRPGPTLGRPGGRGRQYDAL